MTPAGPLASINIPCYHQLDLARRSLDAILAQSYAPLEVTLLDDGASDEYQRHIESLNDARVHYHRNTARLGAMRNMFSAIEAGGGGGAVEFSTDRLLSSAF